MIFVFKKNHLITAGLVLLVLCAVCVAVFSPVSSVFSVTSKGDWGLSYKTQGSRPEGNASSEELKEYNAYYAGDGEERVIYLTFDAGYENGNTPKILDALKKNNVKATFFLVGNYLKTQPELVRRMTEEGHIVANHTLSHPDMSEISDEDSFRAELEGLEKLYRETTGAEMKKYYRPPQGKFSVENLEMANKMGYKTFFWSLAYVDWVENKQPSAEEAFSKLLTRIHPGAVVLLHSTSSTNAEILDELLVKWREMGYDFRNLDEIV